VRSSWVIIRFLWSDVALGPSCATPSNDTHWHVGQPYLIPCLNKWIHVIGVSLSKAIRIIFSFLPSPLLCFCLSSHTIIRGVACRMWSHDAAQHKATSQNCGLDIISLTTLLIIISCEITLHTHTHTHIACVPVKLHFSKRLANLTLE